MTVYYELERRDLQTLFLIGALVVLYSLSLSIAICSPGCWRVARNQSISRKAPILKAFGTLLPTGPQVMSNVLFRWADVLTIVAPHCRLMALMLARLAEGQSTSRKACRSNEVESNFVRASQALNLYVLGFVDPCPFLNRGRPLSWFVSPL